MDWKVKRFNELDTKELYKIIKERIDVFVVEQNCPYSECDSKDLDCYHVLGSEDGEIAAYARIVPAGISYKEVSIGRVLINKKYRGHGLGGTLMEKAMDFIKKELKEDSIRISAQEYLLEFYKNLGFQPVSEVYLEDDIPHIEMLYS